MSQTRLVLAFAAAVALGNAQCTSESRDVTVSGGTGGVAGVAGSGGTSGSGASGGSAGTAGSGGSGGSAGASGTGATGGAAGGGGTSGTGGSAGSLCSPGAPAGGWPDSATKLCTDGASVVTCPSTGSLAAQDGAKQKLVPKYGVSGKEATDSVTGLTWHSDFSANKGYALANTYCTVTFGSSWRLPSARELSSLLDYGRPAPSVHQTFDMPGSNRTFWTTSSFTTSGKHAYVNFQGGAVQEMGTEADSRNVRCVTGTLTGNFQADACGVVVDSVTRLMWPNFVDNVQKHNWTSALAYCDGFSHAGFEDWRVPTAKELLTIVRENGSPPYIDTALFGSTQSLGHWTSTPYQPDPSEAWFVDFNAGLLVGHSKTSLGYPVRCVRDWT